MKNKVAEAVVAANEATVAATTRAFEQTAARTSEGLQASHVEAKEGMQKAMRTAEDLVAFSQGNLEALVKSGQIWAAGMQDISKQVAATAQASLEQTFSTFRAFAGVKSLRDAMELQSSLARSAIEKTMTESGRLTDASMKLAEQAWAPLTARMSMAVEKYARAA
jgi:phasin family protein